MVKQDILNNLHPTELKTHERGLDDVREQTDTSQCHIQRGSRV